jgi:hypothetical protein
VVTRNAAKLSAFNPIERRWAGATKRLACTVLPVCDEGDTKSPSEIPHITPKQRQEKDIRVFNFAMQKVEQILSPLESEGFPTMVHTTVLPPIQPVIDIGQKVDAFIDASNKSRRENHPEILDLFLCMLDHTSKSTYKLQIHPCDEEKCKYNCVARKARASEDFKCILQGLGGRWCMPKFHSCRS